LAGKDLGGHGILSCLGIIVRPGMVVVVTEPPNYTKLSKKIHLLGQRI
jgi:hypothetical protein